MNGPTGYNIRYRCGLGSGFATVTMRISPSTLGHALSIYQALKLSKRLDPGARFFDLEIWRSGEKVSH